MAHDFFTHGYGYVSIDGQEPVGSTNYSPDDRLKEVLYKNLVLGTEPWRKSVRNHGMESSITFLRPGALRYTKPNTLLVASAPERDGMLSTTGNGGAYDQYYVKPGAYYYGYPLYTHVYFDDSRIARVAATTATYATSEMAHTFASVLFSISGDNPGTEMSGVTSATAGGGLPTTNWRTALSWVDIPGTTIGTLWKHPAGRSAWFNEVGIVALSQGSIEIQGPYSPAESRLQHMGYQVYYTKSGGSGRPGDAANALLTAPVTGSSGSVTSPATFVDGAAQGLFQTSWASGAPSGTVLTTGTATSGSSTTLVNSGAAWTPNQYRDKLIQIVSGTGAGQTRWIASNTATSARVSVAWTVAPDSSSDYRVLMPSLYYLRINSGSSKGTYLVISVTDANTLVVDAPAISTPFGSESGLSWEIVTGPVGEYFYRKRAYFSWDSWGATTAYYSSNFLPLGFLHHETTKIQDTNDVQSNRVVHDGGACWWALANNGSVPLIRWVHLSPQAYEPMHTSGKISGLASWPFEKARARDMAVDDQNKIWVVGDPFLTTGSVRNQRTSTLRIDPYPGGNAQTPALLSSYAGDTPGGVATPSYLLGANDIRAVVCDDSKAYAANTRVWLIPGTADALNAVSYSDDYGTNWKRLHPIHARTGTATVSGNSVTGTGTAFTTEFAVGDWIRFDDNTAALLRLSGVNGATYFGDTGKWSSVVTPNGGAVVSTDQSKFGNGSLALNGTDAYLSMPWNSDLTFGTGDFTVECWLYLTATPNGEAFIADQYTGGSDEIAWAFHFTTTTLGAATGDKIAFGSYNGSSWTGVVSTSTPALNTWVHLAACRSGGTLKLFMDGAEIASGSFTTNIPTGDALWVGRRWDTAGTRDFVSGYMNDVRVLKGTAAYISTFTPPAAAFIGLRSYEVQAIDDDVTMTLATAHATDVTNSTISRGVFPTSNIATTALWNTLGGNDDINIMRAPADYSSTGALTWLSADANFVVRWSEASGNAAVLPISAVYGPVAVENSGCCSLTIQRFPNTNGQDQNVLHDSIWIGTRYQGLIRLNGDFSGVNTRYHRSLNDNWPVTGSIPTNGTGNNQMVPRVIVNPYTGAAYALFRRYEWASYQYIRMSVMYDIGNNGTTTGLLAGPWTCTWPIPSGDIGVYGATFGNCSASALCADFDRVGLGTRAAINPSRQVVSANQMESSLSGERWQCKRWDGNGWQYGPLNETYTDISFSTATPFVAVPANVGTGVKRMHPDWQVLDADTKLSVRFIDNNIQSVAQDQQFLADETTTFLCYIGKGKDTSQTAYFGTDFYMRPTYTRFNSETPKLVRNMWTQDGGIEGGYSLSGTSTVDYTPPFSRGISIPACDAPHGGAPLPNLSNTRFNTGPWQQYTAILRLKPQFENTGDGSVFGTVSGSENVFQSATYGFLPADIGKSVIIEGFNGNTVDANNGQAVILSIDPLNNNRVVTDKTFTATASGLRWKLMDIPAVSYVVMHYDYAFPAQVAYRVQMNLYSSSNRGVTWQSLKSFDNLVGKTANTDIRNYQSDGITFGIADWFVNRRFDSYNIPYADQNASVPVIFDIRSLPENVRRRQYWKIRAVDMHGSSGSGNYARSVGLVLLDSNFSIMGVPDNCWLDDAHDPEFYATLVYSGAIRAFTGTGLMPVDIGLSNGRTNTVSFSGSFYTASGTNDASVSGSTFSISTPGTYFTPTSIGQSIRISGSATSSNNGLAVITSVTNKQTVVLDKGFTSDSVFSWALVPFGAADNLRVTDATYLDSSDPTIAGINLSDTTFTIADVPTATTIVLTEASFPTSVTNKGFSIEQNAGSADYSLGNSTAASPTYDTSKRWSYSPVGALAWSATHEFVMLQEDVNLTATSAADDDADGRTDTVTLQAPNPSPLPAAPASFGTQLQGDVATKATVGDYIMLSNSTNGRRVYEIVDIQENTAADTPSVGYTTYSVTIKVAYDEIFVSQTFQWQLLRRRDLTFTYPRVLTVGK